MASFTELERWRGVRLSDSTHSHTPHLQPIDLVVMSESANGDTQLEVHWRIRMILKTYNLCYIHVHVHVRIIKIYMYAGMQIKG